MSKRFKVWCDSGVNIHSCYKTEVSLEDINMSEEDQYEVMREIAFENLDWGFLEIE